MAKQKGIMILKGKVGNFSFYQGQDGYGARNSDGLDGERVKSSRDFERTRENGMEFGRAGRAGKLIRDALTTALQTIADKRLTSRLTTEMVKVVKSDPTSDRGDRCAENGDISILAGSAVNKHHCTLRSLGGDPANTSSRGYWVDTDYQQLTPLSLYPLLC